MEEISINARSFFIILFILCAYNMKPSTSIMKGILSFLRLEYQSTTSYLFEKSIT
jgi:hypothetical protein